MAESINLVVKSFPNIALLSRAVAQEIEKISIQSVSRGGRFTIAVSGGRTPRTLFRLLAMEYKDRIPWSKTHIFWTDERYVSRDMPESNYQTAYETLISKLSLPRENIHRIPTKISPIGKSADAYEQTLFQFFPDLRNDECFPGLDLILLGVGEDGHTASLFPGNHVLMENEKWVSAVTAPKSYKIRKRISFTLPFINRAKNVFFLVSGGKKREVVNRILQDQKEAAGIYPAALIRPREKLIWFLDEEASP
jgi:6-phosphogluconolactonase